MRPLVDLAMLLSIRRTQPRLETDYDIWLAEGTSLDSNVHTYALTWFII
jgi:hypothetical protein